MNLEPWPVFDDSEVQAAVRILKSGKVNYWAGDQGKAFEKEFAEYCGASYGVAVANGSLSLDLALKIMNIGPGDEVIVSARSFFASAGTIVLTGATPVFADVDRVSQNITAEKIENLITPKTKAIICVHLNGWPCDMRSINPLAERNGLFVIEDCAQAHGAKLAGRVVGSWGDAGVFSFCQDKIMSTAGEGGMFLTNSEELWEKAWSFKDHGKSYSKVHSDNHPDGFRWLHESFGTNLRMTEIQSAIGRIQLEKLDAWVERRRRHAQFINRSFENIDCIRTELPPTDVYHSYYKHYIFVRPDQLSPDWSRDKILREFSKSGIPALSGSCPEIYLEKAFENSVSRPAERLPNARELGETSIQFLVHPTITDEQMEEVVDIAGEVLTRAQS